MNKIAPVVLVAGGITLIIFGINATDSFSSDVSRFFTGAPTDKAVWLLVAGVVAAVAGLTMSVRSTKAG
jgi:hypothetical protein